MVMTANDFGFIKQSASVFPEEHVLADGNFERVGTIGACVEIEGNVHEISGSSESLRGTSVTASVKSPRILDLAVVRQADVPHHYGLDALIRFSLLFQERIGDLETMGLLPRDDERVGRQIYWAEREGSFQSDKSELMKSAAVGNMSKLRNLLLGDEPISLDAVSIAGRTSLMYAAENNHLDSVRLLLSHGAKANIGGGEVTPLICAVQSGAEIVAEFLRAGAALNMVSRYGYTALMAAASTGDIEAVKLLLDHGAAHNIAAKAGHTAKSLAQKFEHQEIVSLLT